MKPNVNGLHSLKLGGADWPGSGTDVGLAIARCEASHQAKEDDHENRFRKSSRRHWARPGGGDGPETGGGQMMPE